MARPRTFLELRDRDALTREELASVLDYDPETGLFRWKRNRNNFVRAGDTAGHKHLRGYIVVSVLRHSYTAHRLAWLYHYGAWPDGDLDHANGDPADNRIVNLRPATDRENGRNRGRRSDNRSGLKGVTLASGKWRARIRVDGELRHLGYFGSPEAAHAAYQEAADKYFGEFARFS